MKKNTKELTFQEVQDEVASIMKAVTEICDRNGIRYYCQAGTVLGAVRHGGPIPWDYDADIIVPSNLTDRFVECCVRELPEKYRVSYHTVAPGFGQYPRVCLRGYSAKCVHLDVFQLIGIPDDREGQLAMIEEARQYRDEMRAYFHPLDVLGSLLKRKKFGLFFRMLPGIIRRDTSFVAKMDELCTRYPYDEANYVMNPFGKYGPKNIFRKEVYGEGIMTDYQDYRVRIPSETDFYLKQYYGDYMKFPSEEHIKEQYSHRFILEELSDGDR